jgi:Tol biopolymer transport system component
LNARNFLSAKFLALSRCAFFALAIFCLALPAKATSLQLVTTIDPAVGPPASGGGNSMNPIITPDGRYVLFASTANNLALTSSNTPFLAQSPPKFNVFLRDRTNGTTTLVSVNLAGTGGGNGDSQPIELSTNGQFALFESSASDLVPGDTNNATDVFVRDLVHGTNILVSIGTNGGCANGVSGESAMTPNGRYVAFASTASNLVPNDTNGIRDIFVRDLQNGTTVRASSDALAGMVPVPIYIPPSYTIQAISSDLPEITPDGRYVAFITTFTLPPSLAYGTPQGLFVCDQIAGTTTLVSSNLFVYFYGTIGNPSYNHAISDNGRFVAFESATNDSGGTGIIQRYNLQTGFTDILCTNAIAVLTSPFFRDLDITPDGRFIAFVVNSNVNSYSGHVLNSSVYLWDAQTATMTLVSCDTNNAVPTNSVSCQPAIDSSGQFVIFLSNATGLTTNVVAGGFHLYLRDLLAGSTILLDGDTNGFGFTKDFMNPARLTPDGRFLAFDCTEIPATNIYNQPYTVASSLVPNDNNRAYDVFVRDLTTNTIELISVRQSALPSQTPSGASAAPIFSVDTGGRYIAFASAAASLVPNYTNLNRGVFVQDLLSGTNILVSMDTNGLAGAGGLSSDPSISGDGRYVVFTSSASNLTPGDDKSSSATCAQDVFVRDLQTRITSLISTNATGSGPGNGDSYSPVISANGRYVLFRSRAGNLVSPSISGYEKLFLRNLQAGTTYALATYNTFVTTPLASMTPDGHFVAFYGFSAFDGNSGLYVWDSQAAALIYTNSSVSPVLVAISPDGNRIVYSTGTGFYAVDRTANSNWQIAPPLSVSHAGLQFSGDARFLVYSTTGAQVAFDTNGVADVYLYDFVTRSNFLVSQGNPPGAASGPSDSPAISNDDRFVAYRSTATNLVAGATNGLPNVFLYDRQTGTTTLLSANTSGMAGNNRSFAPQFSGDGQTVVFQSWASDLIPHDFNQVNDLVAIKIATSNPTPVFVGQMVFAPATLQSPTLTWPAVSGMTYQVQFKNNLTDAVWQTLSGNTWVSGNRGYATDLAPNPSLRLYRVVAF